MVTRSRRAPSKPSAARFERASEINAQPSEPPGPAQPASGRVATYTGRGIRVGRDWDEERPSRKLGGRLFVGAARTGSRADGARRLVAAEPALGGERGSLPRSLSILADAA